MSRRPELAGSLGWSEEEEADIYTLGLSLSLPLFDRGRGETAAAVARREVAETLRLHRIRSATVETRRAYEAFVVLDEATGRQEAELLPLVRDSLDLARRAYEAGSVPIGELLVIRSQMLQARREILALSREAAGAWVELRAMTETLNPRSEEPELQP